MTELASCVTLNLTLVKYLIAIVSCRRILGSSFLVLASSLFVITYRHFA